MCVCVLSLATVAVACAPPSLVWFSLGWYLQPTLPPTSSAVFSASCKRVSKHSRPPTRPAAGQVLYDFLVCRGDYKGAARAMAAYAWRLRAEAPASSAEAVAEALRAYGEWGGGRLGTL